MPLPIPGDPTTQLVAVFIIFILFVAVVYRMFKLAFSAGVAAVVGFSFPWINEFLKLGLPITADMRTSIIFAAAAVAVFVAYEFMHYILAFIKIVTWPVKVYFHNREKERVKKLEKEVKKIEKK